jgi:hypothetical protein
MYKSKHRRYRIFQPVRRHEVQLDLNVYRRERRDPGALYKSQVGIRSGHQSPNFDTRDFPFCITTVNIRI